MRSVILLGFGKQGRAVSHLLSKKGIETAVADSSSENLSHAERSGKSFINADLSKRENIQSIVKDFDCAICTLPARLGRRAQEACIDARRDIVDLSYSEENPLELDERAKEAGVTLVPDTGIAPGISNLMAGYLDSHLRGIEMLKILVGGFPEKPVPPMDYSVTWSCEDLIDEYVRSSRILRGGEIVEETALSGIEDVDFSSSSPLEAFYTDGLRTLLYTLKNSKNVEEKTVRYRGHAEKMKFLRDMGYFDEEKGGVNPKKTTVALFNSIKSGLEDVLFMRVYADYRDNGKMMRKSFTVFDRGRDGFSAMERTTGFACASFSYALITGKIKDKGVVCPEHLGNDDSLFNEILASLRDENVEIVEKEEAVGL